MRKYLKKIIILILVGFSFISCCEKKSDDPNEVYLFWSGNEPNKDVKVVNGKYWQSSHFTKEYVVYLEIFTKKKWINEFISQNHLVLNKSNTIDLPNDLPNWFIPKVGYKVYVPKEFSQGSLYFVDEKTGHFLLYEIQL